MKPTLYILTICLFTSGLHAQQSPANIRLKDVTLMHEMRATPHRSTKQWLLTASSLFNGRCRKGFMW